MTTQVSPRRRILFLIYWCLLVLLLLTAIVARIPINAVTHNVFAFGISIAKTVLIAWVFMEVRFDKGIVRVFAGAGLVWLFLLFLLTFTDFLTRTWLF